MSEPVRHLKRIGPGRHNLVDGPEPIASTGFAALLTGGIGDVFALESFTTPERRERLESLLLACPSSNVVRAMYQSLPNYPRLENYRTLGTGGQTCLCRKDVEKIAGPLPDAEDWSIATTFPTFRNYVGSSWLTHRLVPRPRRIDKPYVVIVPHSSWGRWEGRSFDASDWQEAFGYLERHDLHGLILHHGNERVEPHPRLIDLTNQVSILEGIELLKVAQGYLGIDSALSVLAAKLFPSDRLAVKSVWGHCYQFRHIYYAPRSEFGFLRRELVAPDHEPARSVATNPTREITITTCQGVGDTFWCYQLLSPHYDRIHFTVALVEGGRGKVANRAEPWLRLLPKCGRVTTRTVTDAEYQRLAHGDWPFPPKGRGEAWYAVNAALERGERLESLGKVEETVPLPVEPHALPWGDEPYWCVYVSGSTARPEVVRDVGVWTLDQWEAFLHGLAAKGTLPRNLLILGANYDAQAEYDLAGRCREFRTETAIDLPPAKVLGLLKGCRFFVGYQSGLNILADQLDVRKLMLYFPALKAMPRGWPKQKNLDNGTHRYAFFDQSPEEVLRDL